MRWLLAGALAISIAACQGDQTLGPTSTLDGTWTGQPPGFSVSFALAQTDTVVNGFAAINGLGGYSEFAVSGTLVGHTVTLVGTATGFESWRYDGTLSSTAAVIQGHLDGSGFNQLELAVKKKK